MMKRATAVSNAASAAEPLLVFLKGVKRGAELIAVQEDRDSQIGMLSQMIRDLRLAGQVVDQLDSSLGKARTMLEQLIGRAKELSPRGEIKLGRVATARKPPLAAEAVDKLALEFRDCAARAAAIIRFPELVERLSAGVDRLERLRMEEVTPLAEPEEASSPRPPKPSMEPKPPKAPKEPKPAKPPKEPKPRSEPEWMRPVHEQQSVWGEVCREVLRQFPEGAEPILLTDLQKRIPQLKPFTVARAVNSLVDDGVVKRVRPGIYQRVR
jgi:outer membrane biosynthesis protein TonB